MERRFFHAWKKISDAHVENRLSPVRNPRAKDEVIRGSRLWMIRQRHDTATRFVYTHTWTRHAYLTPRLRRYAARELPRTGK